MTSAALMYRPERVQFYCVAASGPHLARIADLPHVAAVVAGSDAEGVARLIATVQNIAAERDKIFTTRGLDMMSVREAKFGPDPHNIGVEGGDVVLVIDGWANFTENYDKHVDAVIALMRARNYGVRVVLTHTSTLSGVRSAIRNESASRLSILSKAPWLVYNCKRSVRHRRSEGFFLMPFVRSEIACCARPRSERKLAK